MASSKNAGRRRFITREHTSDTSEADASSTVKTPDDEECERKRLENISLPRDTPSAFVRVAPSSKSVTLDRTFRGSKNGLAINSSKRLPQQPSVPFNSERNSEFHPASEKLVQQPLIYATLETSTGFPPECDSLSLGFRPIRRDSQGSTSSSLAGSTVDSELTISNAPPDPLESPQRVITLPPRGKDFTDSASKLRPWSYYDGGMLMPRSVLSSTGSASSYDNLDKMESSGQPKNPLQLNNDATQVHPSPSPRFARTKHFDSNPKRTPSPPSGRRHGSPLRSDGDRQFHVVGSRTKGNKTGDASKEALNMSGEDKAESAHFLEGVCRRRMAGGHVQVIPPHLVGVFDPSRFFPSNAHVPSESLDVEQANSAPVVKQPESSTYQVVSKLPSKLPAQPGFARPSESSAKSLLPRVSVQHASNDVGDHSLGVHTNPSLSFASKDSELSRGDNLSRTSVPKLNVGRKSYKNDDSLLSNDASPKFSERHLFSTDRKVGSNANNQSQELSSVTDLFHHVLPSVDASHRGGPAFPDAARYAATQQSKDSQMPKASSFLASNHSSPSKQISPKYAQTSSTQKSSPKWDRTPLSKGAKRSEHISSPKASSPKARSSHDQTSVAKSCPKWERATSAKSNLTSSPKSSPKLERTAPSKHNLKWEAPSTTASAKASQQSTCAKSISKWEPVTASKEHTRLKAPSLLATTTCDHLPAGFSGSGNLEKTENAHILEKTQHNRARIDMGPLRSHPGIDPNRMHERPSTSDDSNLYRSRTDRDKRKVTTTQPQTMGASDSVFSARRKQFSSPLSSHDKVDHQSRTGVNVMVDRASRPAAMTRQNMDDGRETILSSLLKSEAVHSPSDRAALEVRNSISPRKAGDEAVSHSDAASDRTGASSTSSSLQGVEKKGDAGRQRLRKSESGESDAHSTRSSTQGTEVVKISIGEDDALQEVTVLDDGGVMEVGLAGDAVNGNSINSKDVRDSVAWKSAEDAVVSKGSTGSAFVIAKGSTNENEIDASLVSTDNNSNFEVPRSKIQLSTCCSQTKTFTDILENIQVVMQPCGALAASSSQKTPCSTPVFGPPSPCSVHFPFFDVDDEPDIKSSQCTLPEEAFAVATVDLSKEAIACKVDQSSGVTYVTLGGEKIPGSCPGEFVQRKTEQNADVVNNNLKVTGPSTLTISPSFTQTISPSTQTISPSTQTISLSFTQTISPSTQTIFPSLQTMSHSTQTICPSTQTISPSTQTIFPSMQTMSHSTQTIYPSTQTISPSAQTIFLEQSEIATPVPDRRSLDSTSSSSLVELPAKDLLVDENPVILTTATEPVYSFTVSQGLSYPGGVDKAIFTVDKEISFVSGLLESDNRVSTPRKVSPQTSTNLRNAGLVEYLPLRTESNVRLFTESAPFTFVTVSAERETSQKHVDKMPGPFQNLASGNVQTFSTLQSTSPPNVTEVDREKNSLSPSPLLTVFDSCPLSTPVNQNELGIPPNKNDNSAGNDKVVSELDESDETVDPGGTESKVSTASLEQITQETEIFELAKTSAAYLKPEMALLAKDSKHLAGKSELLCPLSVPKPVIQNHDSAKRDFVFTSKESIPVNIIQQPEYPSLDNRTNLSPPKSEVSPVMAALDDALAVLTSVVMENKNTTGDTLPRSTASAAKSKKDALKQEVISNLNMDAKKPARLKSTNKEGTLSKKRVGVSHKEQHAFDDSTPITSHHSDPQEVTDTVRHEIQAVEKRRHQLTKEDSFNRPDSPMFHETLPLPKDSIIKRNREHCRDSSSSSDSGGSVQTSPRLAPRDLRRSKRCQDANKSGSVTTPLEISDYRPFVGSHSSGRALSRHQSDIVLDMQSLTGGSALPITHHPHKTRRHNSESAGGGAAWPKTASLAQGMDAACAGAVGVLPSARDVKRRADRFPLPSDIQQSLLLYNQQHGGRRGQSWMQAVDASVEGALTGTVGPKDKTG